MSNATATIDADVVPAPGWRWRTHFDRLLVAVVIVALWQVGSMIFGVYWLSTPWATTSRFFAMLFSGELIRHSGYTIEESFIGAVIGGVPAVILPFVLRRSPILVSILDPFMVGGYGSPKLALAPLFILWFGIGLESKIALVASVLFFIVYFSTLTGVRALDAKLVQMAQVMGASEQQLARKIIFPAAVPNIFAGFRIGLPYAIGAAVITELISSNRGLGYLVQVGAMNFDTTQCFVAILAATIIVHAVGFGVDGTERLLLRWRPSSEATLQAGGN
ncbi:MAG TPA: ABC transporter permease [Stellaceae bacterium]|nr:ABC transporter permease [Stellaceae bacterium]